MKKITLKKVMLYTVYLVFLPITLTVLVLRKSNWTKKKKMLILGFLWSFFILAAAFDSITTHETYVQTVSEDTEKIQTDEEKEDYFSKYDALVKIQLYKVVTEIDGETSVKTLKDHYKQLGKADGITDLGWEAIEDEDGTFIVIHRLQSGDLIGEAKWRVSSESILTVNGVASTITPELKP